MANATTTPAADPAKRKRRTPRPEPSNEPSRYKLEGVDWILNQTGYSLRTLEQRLADGQFPQPAEGGPGRKRKWTRDQYDRWAKAKQDEAAAATI